MKNQGSMLYTMLWSMITLFIIIGIIVDGPSDAFKGLLTIQLSPGRLINDFIYVGGIGSALINSALVAMVGLILIAVSKVKLSGPTFAAVLTLMGFGLFGKTLLNILPIIAGVYLSSKFIGKQFKEYIIIALFGTALGPVVSFIAFEFGLTGPVGIAAGVGIGVISGFFLPALAVSMLHFHQGYNLYNMGLTCGFLGLFASSFIVATGHEFSSVMFWYEEKSLLLTLIIPIFSIILIIVGAILGRMNSISSLKTVQKFSGRLPSDFMVMASLDGALINCGLVGLVGSLYIFLIDGDFNGPVIGGLLTIIGFGAFGTNLKNAWPVVLGVILSSLLFDVELNSPAAILAAIFVTTLGPIAGQFGFIAGIIAGFIHMVMVLETGSWYGGINLYNNGFAGGLTATIIIAIIQWYKTNRTEFRGKKGKRI